MREKRKNDEKWYRRASGMSGAISSNRPKVKSRSQFADKRPRNEFGRFKKKGENINKGHCGFW